jgi:hypothetical protein
MELFSGLTSAVREGVPLISVRLSQRSSLWNVGKMTFSVQVMKFQYQSSIWPGNVDLVAFLDMAILSLLLIKVGQTRGIT